MINNRKRSLLNISCEIQKLFWSCEEYRENKVTTILNDWEVRIIFPGVSKFIWQFLEPLSNYTQKENVSWETLVNDNGILLIRVWK